MNGKVIFEGKSAKEIKYIIRYPDKKDSVSMHEYINKLSREKTFVNFQGEKISLREETEYLNEQLKRLGEGKKQSVQLVRYY